MTHPIVKKWMNGENDVGGTIAALEFEIYRLEKEIDYKVKSDKMRSAVFISAMVFVFFLGFGVGAVVFNGLCV